VSWSWLDWNTCKHVRRSMYLFSFKCKLIVWSNIILVYHALTLFKLSYCRKSFSWHSSRQTRRRTYLLIGYLVWIWNFLYISYHTGSLSWRSAFIIFKCRKIISYKICAHLLLLLFSPPQRTKGTSTSLKLAVSCYINNWLSILCL